MDKTKPGAKRSAPAQSEQLCEAGFKTLDDAMACLQAVVQDLVAKRITSADASRITGAVEKWRRGYEKKMKERT